MRIFFFAIPVVLGISIFLLGLKLMTAALETLLGFRLRSALIRFTEARTKGFLLGLLVTAFIQSSSAVGAALVVLADTGVLSLTQALGVMLGANVGTTVTAQIVALPLESLALPLCAVGLAVRYGAKRRRMGTALFGLGAVFYGLSCTTAALAPLLQTPGVHRILTSLTATPLEAVFFGMLLTALAQSSSAVTGLVIGLVKQGLLPVPVAVGVALGSNVGTVATTLLASLGRGRASRATAYADLLFNLGGVVLVLPAFPWFVRFLACLSGDPGRQVAHAHTVFNTATALLALPFLPQLAGLAWWGAGIVGRHKNNLG